MDLRFASDSGPMLAGSLQLTSRRGAPGVVLVGGSGPSDRTNGGFFIPLVEGLLAAGVAVLSYDKRGVGASQGSWHDASVDDLARDAMAEVHALLSSGVSEAAATSAGTLLDSLSRLSVGGSSMHAGSAAALEPSMVNGASALAEAGFILDATTWAQLHAWGPYDPTADLDQLAVSSMAIFGAADALVPVVESCAALTASAMTAGRRQIVHVFPRADHRLVDSATGALPPDYVDIVSSRISS